MTFSEHFRADVWSCVLFRVFKSLSKMYLAPRHPRMADKVISGGRPRPKYRVLDSEASQPLLPLASAPDPSSNPPKGSPGENAMRGVRKLSICNIPQARLTVLGLRVGVGNVMSHVRWKILEVRITIGRNNRKHENIVVLHQLVAKFGLPCQALVSLWHPGSIRWLENGAILHLFAINRFLQFPICPQSSAQKFTPDRGFTWAF